MNEKILALEMPMVDIAGSFAGTPDLVTKQAVYDWKCSKDHDRVADLQGQAYKNLVFNNWFHIRDGSDSWGLPFIVVELHEDMTFSEFDYGPGYKNWASVMDLYRWKTGKNDC